MTLTLAEAGELFGEATVREALRVLQDSGAIRESTNGGPE
jgi:DNA-binding GntR family transcriptional regulator